MTTANPAQAASGQIAFHPLAATRRRSLVSMRPPGLIDDIKPRRARVAGSLLKCGGAGPSPVVPPSLQPQQRAEFDLVAHAQARIDVAQVRADSRGRQCEPAGDLLVGLA